MFRVRTFAISNWRTTKCRVHMTWKNLLTWKMLFGCAVAIALGLLWQMSQNGRYQAHVTGNKAELLIVDTRTGHWLKTDSSRYPAHLRTAERIWLPENVWLSWEYEGSTP
jgi:hypothetical protein